MSYRIMFAFAKVVFRTVLAYTGGLRAEGRDRVPRDGGVIIAPNHVSHIDPPLIGLTLPRSAWFIATTELFAFPVLGAMARWLHAYPIKQDSPDRAALRRTEELLRSGNAVVMFPEGHESLDGRLQPLQGGPILVAIRTNCPIVPVAIIGSADHVPPRSFRPRRAGHPAIVRYGEPIPASELAGGLTGRAAIEHGTGVLREALLRLQAPLPAPAPAPALIAPAPEPLS